MSKKNAKNYRYKTEPGPSPAARRAIVVVITLVVIAVAAFFVWSFAMRNAHSEEPAASMPPRTTYGDVIVEGVKLNGMTKDQAKTAVLNAVREQDSERKYTLKAGDQEINLPASSLKITYDTDAVLQKAWDAAEPVVSTPASSQAEQGFFTKLFGKKEVSSSPSSVVSTPPQTFKLTATIDSAALKTTLTDLTKDLNKDAQEPTVKSFDASSGSFTFQDGQNGQQVDIDKLTQSALAMVSESQTGSVEVPINEIKYKKTVADLQKHMQKLGHFTTQSTNTEAGTYNMTRALETINGSVVKPGATFSFLGVVGAADKDAGYKLAGALENGVSSQDYGGGICQASTTLYGAVLRSNGKIVERSPHSIPSSYVKIGQDAAVSYPSLDFKFQNPTDYPMYIQAGADGRTMYCTIYGYKDDSWDQIEVTSQKTATINQPADQTEKDSSLPSGTRQLKSKGHAGYRATAQRVFYKNGQVVKTEQLSSSYYPPKATIYSVGTG